MVQFWQETWHFVHGRFHKTGPHKGFAMYSNISLPKMVRFVYLQALCLYIWEILLFSLQKVAFGYFAKGIL